MEQGLTVDTQYLNIICMFSYKSKDRWVQWKSNISDHLEGTLDISLAFHF